MIANLIFADKETRAEISRPRYGSPFPWPLNHILAYRKQFEVRNHLKAVGWFNKTLDRVYEDVHVGLQVGTALFLSRSCVCLGILLRSLWSFVHVGRNVFRFYTLGLAFSRVLASLISTHTQMSGFVGATELARLFLRDVSDRVGRRRVRSSLLHPDHSPRRQQTGGNGAEPRQPDAVLPNDRQSLL